MDDIVNEMIFMQEPEHETVNFSFGNNNHTRVPPKSSKGHSHTKASSHVPATTHEPMHVVLGDNVTQQQQQQQASPVSASSTTSASTSSSSGFSSQLASCLSASCKPDASVDAHRKQNNSSPTPQTSRRTSGNSITIRITSESDNNLDDEGSGEPEDEEEEEEEETEMNRDRAEDTTSNSTSNENVLNNGHKGANKQVSQFESNRFIPQLARLKNFLFPIFLVVSESTLYKAEWKSWDLS